MLLSSCVIWRHLSGSDFRAECPGGDERLQRLIWERLDDSLAWLESLGARAGLAGHREPAHDRPPLRPACFDAPAPRGGRRGRARVAATGRRRAAAAARDRRLPGRLARERGLLLRANPWSEGDGLDFAHRPGRCDYAGDGRVLRPGHAGSAGPDPGGGLRPARPALRPRGAGLHRGLARDHAAAGRVARERPGAAHRAACVVRRRETNERIEAARAAGGTIVGPRRRHAVHVAAAVTHTIGGLAGGRARRACRHRRSGRRASTPAALRPVATRAGSRRHWCSASPRRSRSPRVAGDRHYVVHRDPETESEPSPPSGHPPTWRLRAPAESVLQRVGEPASPTRVESSRERVPPAAAAMMFARPSPGRVARCRASRTNSRIGVVSPCSALRQHHPRERQLVSGHRLAVPIGLRLAHLFRRA